MNTYTVTVASGSEWLRDTEAPWSYLINAEDVESAKRAAEAHHANEQEDPGCFAIEALDGLPPTDAAYYVNDLRDQPEPSVYTITDHADDTGKWCPWSNVRVTERYFKSEPDRAKHCPSECRSSRVEETTEPVDSQF